MRFRMSQGRRWKALAEIFLLSPTCFLSVLGPPVRVFQRGDARARSGDARDRPRIDLVTRRPSISMGVTRPPPTVAHARGNPRRAIRTTSKPSERRDRGAWCTPRGAAAAECTSMRNRRPRSQMNFSRPEGRSQLSSLVEEAIPHLVGSSLRSVDF